MNRGEHRAGGYRAALHGNYFIQASNNFRSVSNLKRNIRCSKVIQATAISGMERFRTMEAMWTGDIVITQQ